MNFKELYNDKSLKPKNKTEILSHWVLENPKEVKELIKFAGASKDPIKATCLEALEYVSKDHPEIASPLWLSFASGALKDKSPRIKWESARLIGNIAYRFPDKLDEAINQLLINSEHPGTVVRWSTAYALSQILKLKTIHNKDLLPAIENICNREEKNSIKKIYMLALEKSKNK